MIQVSGDQYEGSFKDDQRHGTGVSAVFANWNFENCSFYCYNRFVEEEGWRGFRDGLGQRGLCTGDFGDGGKGGYCGGVDVISNLEQ